MSLWAATCRSHQATTCSASWTVRDESERRNATTAGGETTEGARRVIQLATELSGLVRREVSPDDTDPFLALIASSREHLTAFGDYQELASASAPDMRADLSAMMGRGTSFGIWLGEDTLVGRFDLVPQERLGHYVLGFWLGVDFVGHGFATGAGRAAIRYAQDSLGATDIYAGVTHGNHRSEAVLQRLGLRPVGDMGSYTRFHLALAQRSD
jgi:RimJ/RimL family protein N-acetyltransferase